MRRKKKKQEPVQSMIGRIIDLPLEEFKKEIVDQKVSIGIIQNTKINLTGAYEELRIRKDDIVNQILLSKLDRNDPVVKKTLDGLYAEMTKIELKSLYLTERANELLNLVEVDTTKEK